MLLKLGFYTFCRKLLLDYIFYYHNEDMLRYLASCKYWMILIQNRKVFTDNTFVFSHNTLWYNIYWIDHPITVLFLCLGAQGIYKVWVGLCSRLLKKTKSDTTCLFILHLTIFPKFYHRLDSASLWWDSDAFSTPSTLPDHPSVPPQPSMAVALHSFKKYVDSEHNPASELCFCRCNSVA